MWNIRMRAAKSDIHISGAEGIFGKPEISGVVDKYVKRAMGHPRGRPDKIVITIEEIKQKPNPVPLLPVATLRCGSPSEAREIVSGNLTELGVSRRAIDSALKVLTSGKTLRGAALISAGSGRHMEPDRDRGVRVSRLGLAGATAGRLSRLLSKSGLNSATVKEALTLASKVASCPDVVAEVCISDDPDYTTGYIASRKLGYLRVPNIKTFGELHGGRVFLVSEDASIADLIDYLERTPVMIAWQDRK